MYDGGVITREDIFSNEALEVGKAYAKNLEQAIDANKKFIDSIKEINQLANSVRQVKSNSEYVKIKEKEVKLIEESNNVWKEQDALEKKLISTLKQKELATESTNRSLVKNKLELQELNKQIKQEILERSGQIGAYKKLENALTGVRNKAKDVKADMFLLEQQGKKNSQAYRDLEIRSKALTLQTNILDKGIKDIDKSLGQHQREVGNYALAADALNPIFGRINSQLAIFGTSIEQLANAKSPFKQLTSDIMAVGKSTISFMLTPMGAALTVLGALFALIYSNKDTVVDFNSGLINVGKTTGLADDELTKLGSDIVGLSRKLKVIGVPALLEYATVAGQLGVKGSENILAFTEALAKLETATNIKGEEGGAEIARLLTLTDGGVQNVKLFGDEIVKLGNNFAATEKEILSNATAISQNTGVYKLGRQYVLAYGTATKAVGLEAEITGTAIGETLSIIESSIRKGENIDKIARLTGKSIEELKKQFKTDSGSVLFDFVGGLNAVDKAGGSVMQQLEDLGINQVRYKRVLASLATGGYDTLANSIEAVRNANGALDDEFSAASSKIELQWARMGIAWDNLVLSIENGEGIFAQTGGFLAGEFADYLEKVTVFCEELSLAWNVLKRTFGSTETESNKAKMSIFSLEVALATIRLMVRMVTKQFAVDLPNAYRSAKAGIDVLMNSFSLFAAFIKDVVPKIGPVVRDALNPFAEADTSELSNALKNFRLNLFSSNKEIINNAAKENKAALKTFVDNYKKAEEQIKKENEKLKNQRTVEETPGGESEKERKKREAAERKSAREAEKLRRQKEKDEEERLKKLKKLYEDETDLEIFRLKRSSEINKDLSTDEKRTTIERFENFEQYHKDLSDLERKEAEKALTLLSNFNKDSKALTDEEIQNYLDANTSIDGLTNEQKLVLEKWYADKLVLQKNYVKSSEDQAKKEAEIIAKNTAGILFGVDKDKFDELGAVEQQYKSGLISKEEYEKNLAEISHKYTQRTLEEQLKSLQSIVDLSNLSEDEKLKIKAEIAEKSMQLIKNVNDFERDQTDKSTEAYKKKLEIVRGSVSDFASLFAETFDLNGKLVEDFIMNLLDKTATIEEKIKSTVAFISEITNALYQQRIDEIDSEIERTNEKYEKDISNATGNEKLQERIRIKQQADVEKLEAKKKKEQQKQANANKAFAIAQTVWATAQAIMQAYAQLGPIGGTIAAVLVGTLGAIQINQIRNQEIPKYEFGTRGKKHKGGPAELAEKRPEVVLEPGKDPYLISKRGIYDLPKGTEVIPSVNEYQRLQRTAIMMSLVNEKQELDSYQANMIFDSLYGAEIVDELKQLRKQKQNIIVKNSTNVEIGHELWKIKQLGRLN